MFINDITERIRDLTGGNDADSNDLSIGEMTQRLGSDVGKTANRVQEMSESSDEMESSGNSDIQLLTDHYSEAIESVRKGGTVLQKTHNVLTDDIERTEVLESALEVVEEKAGEVEERRENIVEETEDLYSEVSEQVQVGLEIVDDETRYSPDLSELDSPIDWDNLSATRNDFYKAREYLDRALDELEHKKEEAARNKNNVDEDIDVLEGAFKTPAEEEFLDSLRGTGEEYDSEEAEYEDLIEKVEISRGAATSGFQYFDQLQGPYSDLVRSQDQLETAEDNMQELYDALEA